MLFPDCAVGVSPAVSLIVVSLSTNVCWWEGTEPCRPPRIKGARGCTPKSTLDALIAAAPSEFVSFSVDEASKAETISSGSIDDPTGSAEYYCDGSLDSVTLRAFSWLIGTPNCTVSYLSTIGPGVQIQGVEVLSWGPLVGTQLTLKDIRGSSFAVVAPEAGTFTTVCSGLSVNNSRIAVAGCDGPWSANGESTVAIYQSAPPPSGDATKLISVDAYTSVFGRRYEARFFEGTTDVDASRDLLIQSVWASGIALLVCGATYYFIDG